MDIANVSPWDGFPHPTPRQWQKEARRKCLDCIQSGGRGIVHAVMGAGKSSVIAEVVHSLDLGRSEKVVVTTPNIFLVHDLYDAITERVPARAVGKFYTDCSDYRPINVVCMASLENFSRGLIGDDEVCLWIADEAHRTECDTIHNAHESLNPKAALGFTATPFRADDNEELSLWNDLIYEYTASDAIEDDVVVPPRIIHYDGASQTLDTVCLEMIDNFLSEHGQMPGIVNAKSVESAEQFTSKMQDYGIEAEAIHYQKSRTQKQRIIDAWESGDLTCVTHVDMLSEGADFPFIRWICLRRNVQSKTRFCQELGRALRSGPDDKNCAYVLDPNDLFNDFGLSYQAVLRGDANVPETQQAAEHVQSVKEQFEQTPEMFELSEGGTPVEALDAISSWIRKVRVHFESRGLIDDEIDGQGWRYKSMSVDQRGAIKEYAHSLSRLPERHRCSARVAYRAACNGDMTRGEASDFLSIIFAVRNHGWPE